jgi:hypothetical protein
MWSRAIRTRPVLPGPLRCSTFNWRLAMPQELLYAHTAGKGLHAATNENDFRFPGDPSDQRTAPAT